MAFGGPCGLLCSKIRRASSFRSTCQHQKAISVKPKTKKRFFSIDGKNPIAWVLKTKPRRVLNKSTPIAALFSNIPFADDRPKRWGQDTYGYCKGLCVNRFRINETILLSLKLPGPQHLLRCFLFVADEFLTSRKRSLGTIAAKA